MSAIVLTEEQMEVLRRAVGPVLVCDRDGETLGTVDPDRRHELINEIQWRSSDSTVTYSSKEVSALLQFLEKVSAKEGRIDRKRLDQLIKQFHDQYDGS